VISRDFEYSVSPCRNRNVSHFYQKILFVDAWHLFINKPIFVSVHFEAKLFAIFHQ